MGFVTTGLGPTDSAIVSRMGPEIVRVLRKASAEIQQGRGRAESTRWFGDTADPWMTRLQNALNKMASVVNVTDISVGFESLNDRSGAFAAAYTPTGGWNNYADIASAQGRNFKIRLDTAWNSTPQYRPLGTPADSQFCTLVHELTHLVLGTEDVEKGGVTMYGVDNAKHLASTSAYDAKDNADNWGYFVEEFRA